MDYLHHYYFIFTTILLFYADLFIYLLKILTFRNIQRLFIADISGLIQDIRRACLCLTLNHWPLVSHLQKGVKCLCVYLNQVLLKTLATVFQGLRNLTAESRPCFTLLTNEGNSTPPLLKMMMMMNSS